MTDKPKFGINLYPTEPRYTAAEVKVRTEAAGKFGYELGRKDAGEEIAEALEALAAAIGECDRSEFCVDFADTARDIASRAPGATSDASSGVGGHQEVGSETGGASDRLPEDLGVANPAIPDRVSEPAIIQEVSEAARSPQEPCGCLLGPLHTEADHRDLTKGDT